MGKIIRLLFYSLSIILTSFSNIKAQPFGGFIRFDGIDDELSASASSIFKDNSDFTIEFWFRTCQDTLLSYQAFLGNSSNIEINMFPTLNSFPTFNITFYQLCVMNTNNTLVCHQDQQYYTDLQWHHIAVTYSNSADEFEFYFDGIDGTISPSYNYNFSTGGPLYIGRSGNQTWLYKHFNGYMDELRISNNIRYNGSFTPPKTEFVSDSYTRGLWHFDDNNTSVLVHDYSGNDFHFNATGNPQIINLDSLIFQTDNTLTVSDKFDSYQWIDCTNGNIPISGETNQTFIPITKGSYSVEISQGLCPLVSNCFFYNQSNPVIPKIIGKTTVCEDNETNTYQTSFDYIGTITWNLFPIEAGTITNSTNNSCEIIWNNLYRGAAKIFATGTYDNNSSNSDELYITISRLPEIGLGADKTLCTNDSLSLHANTEFSSYKWNDNSTDTTLLVKVGGEYFVEAQHICGIAYDTIKVIEKQPQINLPPDTLLCKGSNILFDVSLAGNNQYLWQNGIPIPFFTVESAGVYSVTITDEYNCKNEKTVVVSEINPPIWKLPTDTSFCAGNILTLDIFCFDCFYSWQDSIDIQEFKITKTGIYSLQVYNFCDTISKSINATALDCDIYLAVPSAFSPNNDQNNDVLFAVGKNVDNIIFTIFDRWGNIVFETTDINIGWDGTYKGKKLDANVFMYFATAKSLIDGKTVQTKGNVSLIR